MSLTRERLNHYVARAIKPMGSSIFKTLCAAVALSFGTSLHAAPKELTADWSIWIGTLTDSSPALAPDGTIYFGDFDGKFWALNPNGSKKWTFHTGTEIKSSPAVAPDGTIYFGCRDRLFYALAADGKKRWEFATGGWVDSSPALATDGTIYFGSWDKNFYALKPDGSKKWQFQAGGEITSSPAIGSDGRIYFGGQDNKFYAVDAEGQKKWEFETGGAIISSPALNGDDRVYLTSVDGCFYALNLEGKLLWKLKTGGVAESSPVIAQDGTICVGVNHELWLITPDGKAKVVHGSEEPIEASPLVMADKTVCYISRRGRLLDLDFDRNVQWSYYCSGYGYACPAVSPSGRFYLSDKGTMFSAVPAGVPLAKSVWPKFRGNARNTGNVSDREK